MTSYQFYTVDVFTDQVFGGNQLAVFPKADGLTDRQMQMIAREMNLSETTFVFPPENANNTRKLRIFTPAKELPFAGHPTLGTAHVLVATGEVTANGDVTEVVLEEGVGPVPVSVSKQDSNRTFAQLSAPQLPVIGPPPPSGEDLAAILSISPDEISADEPIQAVSCGVPFLFLPVRGLETIERLRINTTLWNETLGDYWATAVFALTRETVHPGSDVHARMFAPLFGIAEDPATGAAAAALAGYLGVREGAATGTVRWRVEQGLEMKRPSFLEVEADKQDGEIVAVRVGGSTVPVSRGEMEVPEL